MSIYDANIRISLPPNSLDIWCGIKFMIPKEEAEQIATPDGMRRYLKDEICKMLDGIEINYGKLSADNPC